MSQATKTLQMPQVLQIALEHHQFGRFKEAEYLYREILAIDPASYDALHLLGVASHQTGRHTEAIDLISNAIGIYPSDPLAHNNLGDAYRTLGRLDDALMCFKQALLLKPDFHEVHNNLGETYRNMGRLDEAITSFQKVLMYKPNYAEAHNNLGLALHAQGRLDDAIACFNQAISIKPDYAKAYLNLGTTYKLIGQQGQALKRFDQALSLKPNYPEALHALADLFKDQGELKRALLCCQKLLQIQPAANAVWRLYSEILQLLSKEAILLIDASILLQAFKMQAIDPQRLERIATAIVCRDPLVQQLLTWANNPQQGPSLITDALASGTLLPLMKMPLLLALLDEALITDYRLERLLVLIRRALLQSAASSEAKLDTASLDQFVCGLALQCFANEYIYAVTAEEEQTLNTLINRIAQATDQRQSYPVTWLAIVASYHALHRLDFAGKLSVSNWPHASVQALMLRQLSQPSQEAKIRHDIPGLTDVRNFVSQAVQQQYEENPYPRWKRHGSLGGEQPLQIALQRRLPYQTFPDSLPHFPEILVAGCGTGSDAFQVAQAFSNSGILAVDISMTSLAYAKRSMQEFGIEHIEFRHADILELGSIHRHFDLIVSSGVLHHMHDPLVGWRVLTSLLHPDGYMNIGLYSRRARRGIGALRDLVTAKGYAPTREGISQFRADVMKCGKDLNGINIDSITSSPDFYSTSACRDLIFHVQEHVFSPLEIQSCLDELGLQFLGFEFANPETRKPYVARFPNNPACDSLANWELVEQDNPDIFAGMYQFWVKKRG